MKLSDRIRLIISENGLKQKECIAEIEQMDENELAAVKAFIDTFKDYRKAFGPEKK